MSITRNIHLAILTRFLPVVILLILGIVSSSCSKNGPDTAIIHGLVLDVYEKPLDNITVQIAHLEDKTFTAMTTSDGSFDINLGDHSGHSQLLYTLYIEAEGYLKYEYEFYVDENRDYFILIRLQSTEEEIVEDDEDDYEALPSFRFAGYNYRFYPYMHYVFWDQAMNSCKTLVLFEYRDWTLPSLSELYAITEYGYKNGTFWSRDVYSTGYPYLMTCGRTDFRYLKSSEYLFDVLFVRKEPESRPSYESLPTFNRDGHTYRVYEDMGTVPYKEALQMCNDLNVNGRTGWQIPSLQDLIFMYEHREAIGGFSTNSTYWSRTETTDVIEDANIIVYIFGNGTQKKSNTNWCERFMDYKYAYRLRPIRMED